MGLFSLIIFGWQIMILRGKAMQNPDGNILADKNQPWWAEQDFPDTTAFAVKLDLENVQEL